MKILRRVHSSSICAQHSLIHCKLLHRIHFTQARLAKIYGGSAACLRCQHSPANLIHTFWLCQYLHNFWSDIFDTLSVIVGEGMESVPWITLFVVVPSLPSLSTFKKDLLAFVTLLVRQLILLHWKSTDSSTHTR